MAAYIDLNAVRAHLVQDTKDYRFCGYAEAVAAHKLARGAFSLVWAAHADASAGSRRSFEEALKEHRELLFGKRVVDSGVPFHFARTIPQPYEQIT